MNHFAITALIVIGLALLAALAWLAVRVTRIEGLTRVDQATRSACADNTKAIARLTDDLSRLRAIVAGHGDSLVISNKTANENLGAILKAVSAEGKATREAVTTEVKTLRRDLNGHELRIQKLEADDEEGT